MSRITRKWCRCAVSSTASTFAKNASEYARGFGSSALQLIGRRTTSKPSSSKRAAFASPKSGYVSLGARPSSNFASKMPSTFALYPRKRSCLPAPSRNTRPETCTAEGSVRPLIGAIVVSFGPHATNKRSGTSAARISERSGETTRNDEHAFTNDVRALRREREDDRRDGRGDGDAA